MGSFISRQPNGLLCRFSTIVDTVTDYNMTNEEYIEMCAEKARAEAKETLEKHLQPFNEVLDRFAPNNMTIQEFRKCCEEMGANHETYRI